MKTTAIFAILAAAQGASAAWLRWTVDNEPTWSPQKTDVAMFSNALDGFTPMPTTAPGHRDLGVDVLKVLKGETEITDWTNSKTCGWLADYPSSAYTCGSSYTCATDSDHHVACIYSTLSTFYHECLDYEAVQLGSCVSIPYGTGCCYHSTQPFCGTYIWTGKPQRNMYQCFASPTVITMLDAPRTVIEASLFSKTHTTPSPTPTTSSGAGSGIGIPPTDTATDLLTDSPTNALTGSVPDQTSGPLPNNTNGTTIAEPKNNTTAIVGGVLGGLLGLMILLLACCCFRKSKAKGKLGFGFTRNKAGNVKNIKNVGKDVEGGRHATNVQILGVKGRDSPVSERTITEPVPLVVNPQHQYITREEHHHHHEAPSNAPSLSHAPIMQNVHVQQQMAAAQQASSALHSSSSLGLVPVPRAESIAPSIVPPVSLHSTDSPQPVHQTHYHIYYTSPKPDETSTEVPAGQQTPTKAPKSDESSIQGQGGVLHGHTRKGSQQSKRTASPIHFDSMGTMGPSYRQSMP